MSSLGCLSELLLLGGVHNVLTQAGCGWLSGVAFRETRARPERESRCRSAWDILSDTDEDLVADDPVVSAAVE